MTVEVSLNQPNKKGNIPNLKESLQKNRKRKLKKFYEAGKALIPKFINNSLRQRPGEFE